MEEKDIMAWANEMAEKARLNFELDHHLMPVFMYINTRREINIIGMPYQDDREKVLMAHILKQLMKGVQVEATLFITEAWIAEVKNECPPTTPIMDLPDAKDGVMFLLQYKDKTKHLFIEIKDGVLAKDAEWIDFTSVKGRLADFKDPEWYKGYA